MEGVTFIMTYLDYLDPAVPEARNLQISQLMSQSVLLLKPVWVESLCNRKALINTGA